MTLDLAPPKGEIERLRAERDALAKDAARKIRPLTNFDCDLIIEAANCVHSYTRDNVRARVGDILAERGIEVGE